MKSLLLGLVCASYLLSYVDSARILCVMPVPGKSHTIIVTAICKELAARKHEVVAITSYPVSDPLPNYKQIETKSLVTLMEKDDTFDVFKARNFPMPLAVVMLRYTALSLNDAFLSHENVIDFLNKDEKFDLVLCEEFISETVMAAFAHRYGVPYVALRTSITSLYVDYLVGNPSPVSHVPDPFLHWLDTHMTLPQRVFNAAYSLIHEFLYTCWFLPKHDALLKKHMGFNVPYIGDILKNTSLAFINHHHSLAFPRAYVPNMVEIGGMHVGKAKPLPKDLADFMDSAKEGVIFFSLGSSIKGTKLPVERRQQFIEAFSRLKQKVLWKFEDEDLPGKPDNVKISKWLPQTDLLAHPNLKLFITHCGLGSITEATFYAVPIIGIPIFAEQPMNAKFADSNKVGKMLDIDQLTADTLHETILEVLENPIYNENAKRRSAVLKDRIVDPMDTVAYWIDYVIRHNGAHHLRSAAQDLNWFVRYSVDVTIILLSMVVAVTAFNIYIVKLIVLKIRNRKSSSKQSPVSPKKNKKNVKKQN